MSDLVDLDAERRRRRPELELAPEPVEPQSVWLQAQWTDGKSTIFEDIAAAQRRLLEKHT